MTRHGCCGRGYPMAAARAAVEAAVRGETGGLGLTVSDRPSPKLS